MKTYRISKISFYTFRMRFPTEAIHEGPHILPFQNIFYIPDGSINPRCCVEHAAAGMGTGGDYDDPAC